LIVVYEISPKIFQKPQVFKEVFRKIISIYNSTNIKFSRVFNGKYGFLIVNISIFSPIWPIFEAF